MTFKTKFKIGDMVKYTNADASEIERGTEGFKLIPMDDYKIHSVQLSCFANSKEINYQLEIQQTWLHKVSEESLLKHNR